MTPANPELLPTCTPSRRCVLRRANLHARDVPAPLRRAGVPPFPLLSPPSSAPAELPLHIPLPSSEPSLLPPDTTRRTDCSAATPTSPRRHSYRPPATCAENRVTPVPPQDPPSPLPLVALPPLLPSAPPACPASFRASLPKAQSPTTPPSSTSLPSSTLA